MDQAEIWESCSMEVGVRTQEGWYSVESKSGPLGLSPEGPVAAEEARMEPEHEKPVGSRRKMGSKKPRAWEV